MPLRFYNTLTGQKEEFRPLHPPRVTLYVCGVTVYDDCHIGHARGAVVFDVLRRFLAWRGFEVTHIRNITDVDDKIIARARQESPSPVPSPRGGEGGVREDLKTRVLQVAQRYTASFQNDFARLGLLRPDHEPKATEYIPPMIAFIQGLLERGMAYVSKDGVYFSVRRLPEYGRLSHQKLDQMLEAPLRGTLPDESVEEAPPSGGTSLDRSFEEGARVEAGKGLRPYGPIGPEGKKDPLDFALWKKAKPEEPAWESPWGAGRPGWHIECSTMSTHLLGDAFDIHGGGQDLIFPHHENERAQALGAGKPFARFWLHNGLLTVNGQKMSKSLGNFVTIGDALGRHPADVLRLFFLSAHYRSPLDFTWERLDEAAHAYDRWAAFLRHASALGPIQAGDMHKAQTQERFSEKELEKEAQKLFDAMDDDLNTPKALAVLHILIFWGNMFLEASTVRTKEERHACVRFIRDKVMELGRLLGFFQEEIQAIPLEIEQQVKEREKFRKNGGYATADRIRKDLLEKGWVLEDTPEGTVVRKRV